MAAAVGPCVSLALDKNWPGLHPALRDPLRPWRFDAELSMIKWIDIISPRLKALHQEWMALRESQIMPHLGSYNRFATSATGMIEAVRSICVVAPPDGKPIVKHIGSELQPLMPACRNGMRLCDACSPAERNPVVLQLPRVLMSRQPESRRSRQRLGGETREIEVLFLPFGDDRLRVCLVHVIYDLAGVDWKRAFA
jgi:hypothetical protein